MKQQRHQIHVYTPLLEMLALWSTAEGDEDHTCPPEQLRLVSSNRFGSTYWGQGGCGVIVAQPLLPSAMSVFPRGNCFICS